MEYVEGSDLQRLVERVGPLPPGRVVNLLSQVLASLGEAHALRLLHRDIKPANVMVLGSALPDDVRVLDFGFVVDMLFAGVVGVPRLVGTPAYVAPECLDAPGASTAQADLYSVAAVGYFLLTATTVFRASSVGEMLWLQRTARPQHPSERLGRPVPESLAALLLQGLAKDPNERPASADAFRRALRACNVVPYGEDEARAFWSDQGRKLVPAARVAAPVQNLVISARDMAQLRAPEK
jgi:serine/threonine-protein kinase